MLSCHYLECLGQEGEYEYCGELTLSFEADNFTSTYKSNDEFRITLKGQRDYIDFINADVVIYKDGVGEVMKYSCLSGEN